MSRRFAPCIAGAILILSLAACTAAPTTSTSPSPAPAPAPSDSPAPPTATAEPTIAPVDDATCENVLTPEEYERLAADGLAASAETTFPLGPAMVDLMDDGALDCHWAADQSDVAVWFARLHESEEAWATRKAGLLAAGWTEGDEPVPGTLTAPPDYDANYIPSMVHVDGVTYFVSYDRFLASVAALS
jgi:hypothetical protein